MGINLSARIISSNCILHNKYLYLLHKIIDRGFYSYGNVADKTRQSQEKNPRI